MSNLNFTQFSNFLISNLNELALLKSDETKFDFSKKKEKNKMDVEEDENIQEEMSDVLNPKSFIKGNFFNNNVNVEDVEKMLMDQNVFSEDKELDELFKNKDNSFEDKTLYLEKGKEMIMKDFIVKFMDQITDIVKDEVKKNVVIPDWLTKNSFLAAMANFFYTESTLEEAMIFNEEFSEEVAEKIYNIKGSKKFNKNNSNSENKKEPTKRYTSIFNGARINIGDVVSKVKFGKKEEKITTYKNCIIDELSSLDPHKVFKNHLSYYDVEKNKMELKKNNLNRSILLQRNLYCDSIMQISMSKIVDIFYKLPFIEKYNMHMVPPTPEDLYQEVKNKTRNNTNRKFVISNYLYNEENKIQMEKITVGPVDSVDFFNIVLVIYNINTVKPIDKSSFIREDNTVSLKIPKMQLKSTVEKFREIGFKVSECVTFTRTLSTIELNRKELEEMAETIVNENFYNNKVSLYHLISENYQEPLRSFIIKKLKKDGKIEDSFYNEIKDSLVNKPSYITEAQRIQIFDCYFWLEFSKYFREKIDPKYYEFSTKKNYMEHYEWILEQYKRFGIKCHPNGPYNSKKSLKNKFESNDPLLKKIKEKVEMEKNLPRSKGKMKKRDENNIIWTSEMIQDNILLYQNQKKIEDLLKVEHTPSIFEYEKCKKIIQNYSLKDLLQENTPFINIEKEKHNYFVTENVERVKTLIYLLLTMFREKYNKFLNSRNKIKKEKQKGLLITEPKELIIGLFTIYSTKIKALHNQFNKAKDDGIADLFYLRLEEDILKGEYDVYFENFSKEYEKYKNGENELENLLGCKCLVDISDEILEKILSNEIVTINEMKDI